MAELSELKRILLQLSDDEIIEILGTNLSNVSEAKKNNKESTKRWFDQRFSGLDKDGLSRLSELESQRRTGSGRNIDERQLNYLKTLKSMRLRVPEVFRKNIEPHNLYTELKSFCIENDIPEEIVARVVPSLITYIDTGHMRPIIFVGEKGCGKTTAVKMLVEKALQIPSEVIKIPQTDGSHGMTGDCGSYQSADAGCIAKARLRCKSLLIAYIFDEIDKIPHRINQANVDDELLSITDESNNSVYDNYLETTIVGLEYCPMFFTANDLNKINPILADRCSIIKFPEANTQRIKSICKKYAEGKLNNRLYSNIEFDYEAMNRAIEMLVSKHITSLRKHQQMIEGVLDIALNKYFSNGSEDNINVTDEMFDEALCTVSSSEKQKIGF